MASSEPLVHAGARVYVHSARRSRWGALGLVLGDGKRPSHAITAGHLFAPRGDGTVTAFPGGIPLGRLAHNLLDTHGMDVAVLELTKEGVAAARRSKSPVAVSRVAYPEELAARKGRAYLATKLRLTGVLVTAIETRPMFVTAPARPKGYTVTGVVYTKYAWTDEGDSGTLLVSVDRGQEALGVCTGRLGAVTYFEPLHRALKALRPLLGHLRIC